MYGTAVPVHGRDADKLQHQVYDTKGFVSSIGVYVHLIRTVFGKHALV